MTSVNYPQLNALDRSPVPHISAEKPVEEEHEDELEIVELDDPAPVGKLSKFKAFIARFRVKGQKREENEDDDSVPLVPSTNPEKTSKTLLEELVDQRASAQELVRGGFKSSTMEENNLSLQDMYDACYTVRDLSILIPDWHDLVSVGFNKYFLGDRWHIDHLATYYPHNKLTLCRELEFTMHDFMRARTTPNQYRELNINAQVLLNMQVGFEELFALHYTLDDMVEVFGVGKKEMLDFNLTGTQRVAMAQCRGWDYIAMKDKLRMTESEMDSIGMALS